jgi:hypothetical protein
LQTKLCCLLATGINPHQIGAWMMFILVAALTIVGIFAMPYKVPLQGQVGGKRTLVLLDDLVSFF